MKYAALLAVLILAGCASHAPAPVIERTPAQEAAPTVRSTVPVPRAGEGPRLHTVKRGDTLYSIALEHGQDYRDVATWNNLDNPNRIQVGQALRVASADGDAPVAVVRPVLSSAPVEAKATSTATPSIVMPPANSNGFKREPKGGKLPWSEQALASLRQATTTMPAAPPIAETAAGVPAAEKPGIIPVAATPAVGDDALEWAWPTGGKVLTSFGEGGQSTSKGIDIAGQTGDAIHAAGDGKVTLVSSALRGYGNVAVIKHNLTYLSVYAHNSKILVKEGQTVKKGQKIAEVGSSDTDQPKLHFEIRREGKPIDPLKYLPAR